MSDSVYNLKNAIRGLIFNGDPMLRKNLVAGTQILHSKKFPTQVFELKGKKYIRLNADDINKLEEEDELDNLLKFMLSMESFSGYDEDTPPELKEILTKAAESYQMITGEDILESSLVESDEFGNVTKADEVPVEYKSFGSRTRDADEPTADEEAESEAKDDKDMTKMAKKAAESCGMIDTPPEKGKKQKEAELTEVERVEVEHAIEDVKTYKNKSRFSSNESILNKKEIQKLNALAKQLLKAFKGSRSKEKTITPKKHINAKSLATDNDRFYVNKKAPKGKHIDFNLVIDMSGSMSGAPVRNAVSLIYIFNKLAQQGYVTGNVIYSSTREYHRIEMPRPDGEILGLHETQSSEGLAETVDENVEHLRHRNLICITDGDIVDRPIDKLFWRKNKIVSTGVYINPNLKDPLDYTGSLDKWFNHSLVRQNLEDMVQLLVKIGIRG